LARIDDLVAQVADKTLQLRLRAALADMKKRQRFGLVFEEHTPETTTLDRFPIHVGAAVQRRSDAFGMHLYHVKSVRPKGKVIVEPEGGGAEETVNAADWVIVKRFGDPIFPTLSSVGVVSRGPTDQPHHAVINGENFHTLQLLVYLYEGQVDCIYIDPPYNTGARDWKYNNHYVDKNDSWRHSKWLSMIEKRLKLAQRLLKPNGVLIVTIDNNEANHLGMLLEKLFPDARRQMVSICINPSGVSGEGLSRVDEYAFFCFFGNAEPTRTSDDMLTDAAENGDATPTWESLLRRGNAWYRRTRPNLCYPVLVDRKTKEIVGAGAPFSAEDDEKRAQTIKGYSAAWPVRKDGKLGIWRVDGKRLMWLVERGYAYASSWDNNRGTWSIKYLMEGTVDAVTDGRIAVEGRGKRNEVLLSTTARRTIAKTLWHRGRHTAGGAGGTQALAALLGERNLFPFPKSIYSVRDCIEVAIGDRPNALILDFFAGSGTTFHATCLLNAADDGHRRCVLVTNNEVEEKTVARLSKAGVFRGDAEYEANGIFEQVTRPRCEAVVTGVRPDGKSVEGEHIDGRAYADGFEENVEFFRIEYLDPDEIDLGGQFEAIFPSLWLAAGGVGARPEINEADMLVPPNVPYAILFREEKFRKFLKAIAGRDALTHVWIVTDSEDAFAEMRAALHPRLITSMLYRDYLRNFRINTRQNL
jgi:adenine-specific DNA-methyltransferase